ncbi:PREDICTED: DNA polymerase epsilon subunit 2 [Ceratosolen solmsi marchali]|uniref:DNA polymerase epsilon subunit n=1 Tax=Ceratosolen solmsi marchali TaxID=326594 RepID=A0AAJ6YIA1_9HYME|nr:PREDICTED: DNA polymerase epsilon subunit 2 [Ceratosolen solmsi marchali]
MADSNKLTKLIHTTFNIYGLKITRKLSVVVAKHLQNNTDLNPEIWLTKIIEQILGQNLPGANVDLDNIKLALKECFKPESTLKETESVLNVIDIFTVPKVVYDTNKKKYTIQRMDNNLFSEAVDKSFVFKERLDLLWYRTQRHASFAPAKFGKTESNKLQLVPIEFLLSQAKTKDVCIMGLLSQITEGQYYLEDYTGSIKIDLKDAFFSSSLIMEGSIVLAKGRYVEGILQVDNIDFPPPDSVENSRVNFGDSNTFGGSHPTSLKLSEKLKAYEEANKDNFIIVISEFWVDSEIVLSKFKVLLSGFSESPPTAIVLCGHFLSFSMTVTSVKKLKEGFKRLAAIIAEFPVIQKNTSLILVPGPYDLSAPNILPRAPLPKYVLEDLLKILPNTYLATNPCRLQYCTKEIVIFRENMLSKLCRNTLHYPKKEEDEASENRGEKIYEAFAKSIIRQSHLTPLLFSMIPVYWKHDQALHLYPTPDLIIVADDFQPYATSYANCKVINPGPFSKSNFAFKCYNPADNIVEDCEIPADDG